MRSPGWLPIRAFRRGQARQEYGSLVKLALPLIFAQLAQIGMQTVDTVMAGRLGQTALAGIALGGVTFSTFLIIGMGILLAVPPLVSQAIGAREPERASRTARQGLWLALAFSVPGVFLFQNAEFALRRLGQSPEVVELASAYLAAVSFGFIPALLLIGGRGFLEGIGDTRPIMIVQFGGIALNVLANNALMFGRWGFPALGLVGTGIATTIVYTFMTTAILVYIGTRHANYRVLRGLRRPDFGTMREIIRVGWPITFTLAFEVSLFSAAAVLMGLFGEAALAGHQIAVQAASITFMIPLGLATATGIRTARAAGARDPDGVVRAGTVGLTLSVGFMLLTAALFRFAPELVVSAFLDIENPASAGAVTYAVTFLGFAALFQVVDGVQVVATGALRGLKDTRGPMAISLLSYWMIGMTTSIVLAFVFGFEGEGLWTGLVVGLAVAAVLLTVRFYRLGARVPAAGDTHESAEPAVHSESWEPSRSSASTP